MPPGWLARVRAYFCEFFVECVCVLRVFAFAGRITPFAPGSAQVSTQLVAAPMHYLCQNTRTDYDVLTLSEL